MRVRDLYSPGARIARAEQPLADAARTMLEYRVGALIVVPSAGTSQRPIGILTDRDIVRGQLRRSADLYCLTVGDVMTPNPLTVTTDHGVTEAIELMNARAVRRAPVLDASGNLLGIVTLDDLVPAVAEELAALASLMGHQARHERLRQA